MTDTAPRQIRITVADVIEAAAHVGAIGREDVLGYSRELPLVAARHAAVWVARHVVKRSPLTLLGRSFRRDHSTLVSSLRSVRRRLAAGDDRMAALVVRITVEAGVIAARRARGETRPEPGRALLPPPQPAAQPQPPPRPLTAGGNQVARARDLRRRGWSISGIARHLGVDPMLVAGAIGEGSAVT